MQEISVPAQDDADIFGEAARWYAEAGRPVDIPAVILLRQRFGLTALQACQAIAMAQKYRPNQRIVG